MEHNQASCRGITNRKEENTVFRGKHTTSTILLNARHSEDIPRTAVIIQDSDGRWICLAPFYLNLQRTEQISNLRSRTDALPSPPLLFFQIDLPQDQMIHPTKHAGSTGSFNELTEKHCGKPHLRNKRSRSLKNSSNEWLQNCFLPNNPSRLACEDQCLPVSKVLDEDIPKIDKTVKRNPKKKGKKKGKRCKRSTYKKEHTEAEILSERSSCKTTYFDASCSGDGFSEGNSSNSATYSCSSVQTPKELLDAHDTSNNCLNHSIIPPSLQSSCNEKMNWSEPMTSFSLQIDSEGSSCNSSHQVEGSHSQNDSYKIQHTPDIILPSYHRNHTITNHNDCSVPDSVTESKSCLDDWNSNTSISGSSVDNDIKTKSWYKNGIKHISSESQVSFNSSTVDMMTHASALESESKSIEEYKNNGSITHKSKHHIKPNCASGKAYCQIQTCTDMYQPSTLSKEPFMNVHGKNHCRNHSKKRAGVSSDVYPFPNTNTQVGTVKDAHISHSVWQRVQKKDVEEIKSRPKNLVDSSLHSDVHGDIGSGTACIKNTSTPKKNRKQKASRYPCLDKTSADISLLSTAREPTDRQSNLLINVPEKSKAKYSSILKHGIPHYKESFHKDRTNDSKLSKDLARHDNVHERSVQAGYQETHASNVLSTCSHDRQTGVIPCSPELECHLSDQHNVEQEQTSSNGSSPLDNLFLPVCVGTSQTVQSEFVPLSKTSNCKQNLSHDMHSSTNDSVLCTERHHIPCHISKDDVVVSMKSDFEEYCTEHSMKNIFPVRGDFPVTLNSANADELMFSSEKTLYIINDKHVPNHLYCPTSCVSLCSSSSHESLACSTSKNNMIINRFNGSLCEMPSTNRKLSCSLNLQKKFISALDTDLDKIVKVVNDAHSSQTISEEYHLVTGIQLAEFERVLQSASPVIKHMCNFSPNHMIADTLFQRQYHRISLGNLWRWFENPGNYGLEVKVEDRHLKNMGNSQSEFRAYFVPYLSAVQIFGRSESCMNSSKRNLDGKVNCNPRTEISKVKFELHNKPQPQKRDPSFSSGMACSPLDENYNDLIHSEQKGDTELLFEYFESDPPQHRKPLFTKIKELARGDISSNSKIFGNPSTLEYLDLNDIHPASWFSVSWYPIYRIPDGNFRAAFLTYHSLGNLIHRNDASNPNSALHIVCPAVGLQSYNSKGECWFRANEYKFEGGREKSLSSNSSKILEDRLRTLEQTASVMARASVYKGALKSVNKQPDYEFFLSRSRRRLMMVGDREVGFSYMGPGKRLPTSCLYCIN